MRFGVCVRLLDSLLGSLRGCLDGFPDKRRGINTTYPIGDIGMAAFSVFFMQSPSFLAHQQHFEAGHGRSNCTTLFGMTKIPRYHVATATRSIFAAESMPSTIMVCSILGVTAKLPWAWRMVSPRG
jgi:hypothetical protein